MLDRLSVEPSMKMDAYWLRPHMLDQTLHFLK